MVAVNAPMPNDARHQVLYRLVGQIITHWAHTEWQLVLLFSALAHCDLNKARIVIAAQQNFRAKRELIERLGRAYLPIDHIDEFEDIMARVKHLSEKRNMVAHHRAYYLTKERVWRFMNDSDATQPNTFGRYQDVQTGNLRIWVREIDDLGPDLMRFFGAVIQLPLRAQPRLFGELEADRARLAAPDQGDGHAEEVPPQ